MTKMKIKFLSQRIITSLWFSLLAFLAYFAWSGIFFGFSIEQFDIFKLIFACSALLVGFLYGYKTLLSPVSSIKFGMSCGMLTFIVYVIWIVCIDMFKTCNFYLNTTMISCYPEFVGFFKEIIEFGSITFLFGGWLVLILGPLIVISLRIFYKMINNN